MPELEILKTPMLHEVEIVIQEVVLYVPELEILKMLMLHGRNCDPGSRVLRARA